MSCATCQGEGYVMVRCCGPRSPHLIDCCCGYSGGKTPEPCPECEGQNEVAAPEAA